MLTNRANAIKTSLWPWFLDNRLPILCSFTLGLIVHFPIFVKALVNPDTIVFTHYYQAGIWEYQLGRWGLPIVDHMLGGPVTLCFSSVGALALLSLVGIVVCDALGVGSVAVRTLACSLLCTSPYVAVNLTYYYCSRAYALAYLLTVFAVGLMSRDSVTRFKAVVASMMMVFALSLYQTSINIALVLLLFTTIVRPLIRGEAHGSDVANLIMRGLWLALCLVAYYGLATLILHIQGIDFASYGGANSVGLIATITAFPNTSISIYKQFVSMLFGTDIARNAFRIRWANAGIMLAFMLKLLHRAIIEHRNKGMAIAMIALTVITLPIACNFVCLFAPDNHLAMRMTPAYYLVPMSALCYVFDSGYSKREEARLKGLSQLSWLIVGGCALMLLWGYASQVGIDYLVMDAKERNTEHLVERIQASADQYRMENGSTGSVIVMGRPSDGNFAFEVAGEELVDPFALQTYFWNTDITTCDSWHHLAVYTLGTSINDCPGDYYEALSRTDTLKAMSLYPNQGSITEIDGNIVIKVADILWDK